MLGGFLLRTEFRKNILVLMTGTALGQIIPFVMAPILSRLYTPSQLGCFALYFSISAVLSTAVTGRYELAIVLPKDDEDALNILGLCFFMVAILGSVLLIFIKSFQSTFFQFLGYPSISIWFSYIPLSLILTGTYQSFSYWFNRKKQYAIMAKSQALLSITGVLVSLMMAMKGLSDFGLILGFILGQGVGVCYLALNFIKNAGTQFCSSLSSRRMFSQSKRYINFPRFELLNVFFYQLSNQAVIILLNKFFISISVGFYIFAEKIILVPFSFFTEPFNRVFLQKLTDTFNFEEENFVPLIEGAIKKMVVWITIPYLLFCLVLKLCIGFVFGQKWIGAYDYILILSPAVYMVIIAVPVSFVLKVVNKQHISLVLNFLAFLSKTAVLIVVFRISHNIYKTVFFSSLVTAILTLANIYVIFRIIAKPRLLYFLGAFILLLVSYVLIFSNLRIFSA